MPETLDINSLAAAELISLVNETGGQRAFSRKYGIPRTTLQKRLKDAKEASWGYRPVMTPIHERVETVRRFILTSAQDHTQVHPFLSQLEAYTKWLNQFAPCELMISGFTYNKSLFEDVSKRSGFFHPSLQKYLVWDRVIIGDKIDFCAELNTRPTATTPLNGCEVFTEDRWGVFPHAKLQIKSVATHKQKPAKLLFTTGCVTQTNYVPLRAGIAAETEHSISAVLVEIDPNGRFFCRHLVAEEDGSFYDLDRRVSNGEVTRGHTLKAITWGDLHVKQIDPLVCAGSFGLYPTQRKENGHRVWVSGYEGALIDVLKPEYQFMEDVSDFYARNHHNIKNPHHQFQIYIDGDERVEDEIYEVGWFLQNTSRPFCQTVVVNSNHDQAFDKWLNTGDYKNDHPNARFFLQCLTRKYVAMESRDRTFSIFKWVLTEHFPDIDCKDICFLAPDQSFDVLGIENGMHGHEGVNGSRGSLAGYRRTGMKGTFGHAHGAGTLGKVWQSGTKSKLDLGYNGGMSNWSHSDVATYQNGNRVLITFQGADWNIPL